VGRTQPYTGASNRSVASVINHSVHARKHDRSAAFMPLHRTFSKRHLFRIAAQGVPLLICAALLSTCGLAQAANPRVKEVIVVFKTHFDVGYTDLVTNVLNRYRTKFVDGAMKLIEDSQSLPPDRRFVWTVPGWPLTQMLWPGQTPERREEILRALKN